ncbi:MAG: DUF5939 domain-containing protein [Elusimicrobiota bacterium]
MTALILSAKDKLAELASSRCSPKLLSEIRRLLERGSDRDCYKINAFRIADAAGVSRIESLRGFLFATRLGLMDMNYDVHCPNCRGLPAFHKHLMGLKNLAHCMMCETDFNVSFEENVEVTFTPNADVRRIRYRHQKNRGMEGRKAYFFEIVAREGRLFPLGDFFRPGETKALRGDLEPGNYRYYHSLGRGHYRPFEVRGPKTTRVQTANVTVAKDGSIEADRLTLRPGPVEILVGYRYPRAWGFCAQNDKPLKNWVSAAYVTSQQDYRDLFGGDFLAPDVSFAIRSTTLMFTDIKASTRMYERLGDSRAYAVVQGHFRVMTEAIRRHEGGIVKTIGDAVMASFPANADAVKAAHAIQEALGAKMIKGTRVEVKIGIHRGPSIAVTSNRSLDYFGRMVNVAARAQGESRAGEIVLTEAALRDPAVSSFLKKMRLSPRRFAAALKGVGGKTPLFRIKAAP